MTQGDTVRVIAAVDPDVYDVSRYLGRVGRVTQILDEAPGVCVRFSRRRREVFFPEELEPVEAVDLVTP